MKKTIPISVTVITHNEENTIFDCLDRLRDFDEIILVDSESSDRTLAIAKTFSNARTVTHPFQDFSTQKNLAASLAQHDWVLNIDADERVTEELVKEIRTLSEGEELNKYDVYAIYWQEYMWGKFMRYGGWNAYHARLYNRRKTEFIHQVHESLDEHGCRVGKLHGFVLHFSHTSLLKTLKKFNQYTELEAEEMMTKNPNPNQSLLFLKAHAVFAVRFGYHLIFRKAFLDGWHGILASFLLGFYYFLTYIKYFERAYKMGTNPPRNA